MTVYRQIPSVGRLELFTHPDGRDIKVYDGSELLGWISPVVLSQPDGAWCAKKPGKTAKYVDTKKAALEYLAGRPVDLKETR